MSAQCIWSREGVCRAYRYAWGPPLPCNGRKSACFGKGEELVETEEYRVKRVNTTEEYHPLDPALKLKNQDSDTTASPDAK
jgi:hypothetical protein